MASNLWKIVNWAQQAGPVKAVDRIALMVFADAMKEKVSLASLDINTSCSPKLEQAVRKAAETVVKKRCPV